MCNIAGYAGDRPAAPILIEMMRRQEGLDGGYYTGIATIHEGRIYHAKLTGDLQHLIDNSNALELPGNIGIIHSRTNSGGGDEWAHPFIGNSLGRPAIAYVANGSAGAFADRQSSYNSMADDLFSIGYEMTRSFSDEKYNTLADGSVVHMSDLLCQDIMRHIDEGISPQRAMGIGFCEMPSEIAGLMLSTKAPDSIIWSRLNMPMNYAYAPHGVYLASSALGFLEDAEESVALPPCCSGTASKSSMSAMKFENPPAKVPPLDSSLIKDAYLFISDILSKEAIGFPELRQRVREHFFGDTICPPAAHLTYDALYALKKEGALKIETRLLKGAREDLKAPKFYLSI